jgi:hypothetical protein
MQATWLAPALFVASAIALVLCILSLPKKTRSRFRFLTIRNLIFGALTILTLIATALSWNMYGRYSRIYPIFQSIYHDYASQLGNPHAQHELVGIHQDAYQNAMALWVQGPSVPKAWFVIFQGTTTRPWIKLDDPWGDPEKYNSDKWLQEHFAPYGPLPRDYGLPRYGLANI